MNKTYFNAAETPLSFGRFKKISIGAKVPNVAFTEDEQIEIEYLLEKGLLTEKNSEKKTEQVVTPEPEVTSKVELIAEPTPTEAPEPEQTETTDIEKMSKKQLEAFARESFDVELDRRKSLKDLRNQVTKLIEG